MNYFVVPIIYSGSCFEDIAKGIIESSRENGIPLKYLPLSHGKLKGSGLENPNDYFCDSINKLKYLAKVLKQGDKVLFMDYFCPGLDLLNYYLARKNISVYKIALIHGASFVDGDIYQEFNWFKDFEKGWISIYDKIISPSKFFLKNLSEVEKNKFVLHPWGLDNLINPTFEKKKYDVIFPHRLSRDKGVNDFIKIIEEMPDLSFCITGLNLLFPVACHRVTIKESLKTIGFHIILKV